MSSVEEIFEIDYIHYEASEHWYDRSYWYTKWTESYAKLYNRVKDTEKWKRDEMLRMKLNELIEVVNSLSSKQRKD